MKKNVFALSVATVLAALAGSANAQVPFLEPAANHATEFLVNAGGVGHVLLNPYYTVQGSRNTLMNIVNTDTANAKAVKVRFRGARNSDDVFDFYVFLSPGDVWRTRLYRNGEQTYIDLPDTSCTLPSREVVMASPFNTARVYDKLETEVREGYVELLNAADIPPGSDLYDTIKHHPRTGAVECDDVLLTAATQPLTTVADAEARGLSFPTRGLIGHWAIVDVSTNTGVSGNATALAAVIPGTGSSTFALGNIVISPQEQRRAPDSWTAVGNANQGTTDPLLTSAFVRAQYYDFPDLSTPYVAFTGATAPATTRAAHQANEISQGLAVSQLINEFSTGMGVDLKTDWVFSMPTRRYGVAINYDATGAARFVSNPQSAFFGAQNVMLGTTNGIPELYTDLEARYFDNDERGLSPVVSPGSGAQRLSGEVNVLSFNNDPANSVLGAVIAAQRVNPVLGVESIQEGWASIDLTNPQTAGTTYRGTPVIGYAALTAGSSVLGFTWPHRYNR